MFPAISIWLSLATWFLTALSSPINPSLVPRRLLARVPTKPTLIGSPARLGAGTYPRATRLRDNSILAVYTSFQSGSNVLLTVRSTNNGASWSPAGEITRGASASNDIDNAFLIQLPNSNRILCAFRNHSKDPNTRAYTYFRITITYSDDGGVTWKYLSQPAGDNGPATGSWEPFLRNALDGSLQLYYSRENSAQDQDTLQRISRDGGASWSGPTTISGAGITSRDGMTSVATLNDGSGGKSLILVYETSTTGLFSLGAISSSDDGRTWWNRRTIYTASSAHTSAGAPQVVNVGGTLVVSFMTNEDERRSAPSSSYTDHTAVKVITSGDLGRSWGNKMTVGEVQSSWPGVMDLGGQGKFLYLMERDGARGQAMQLS
ncbi:MAG: hypothetical protein Q9182_003517 [Xanthomendoza sp. 2 TL-2023]